MARTTDNRRNVTYGGGRNRKVAIKLLSEATIKIAKADRTSKVVDIRLGRVTTSVENIEIAICPPFHLRLSTALARKYLTTLFTSDPIGLPFQLDVWTPFKKVLNVEYDGSALSIMSFRRGPWEETILAASKTVSVPCGEVVIKPTVPIRAAQDVVCRHHTVISITQEQWNRIRDSLLHDGPPKPFRWLSE